MFKLPPDMFMPECLCKEALQDSQGDCVAVQLAALLKMPLNQVHDEIDEIWRARNPSCFWSVNKIYESWQTAGVDSRIIGEFVTKQGMNCYVLRLD